MQSNQSTAAVQENPSGFTTFPVERLVDNTVTDFDLYLQIAKHFILYGGSGYRWERNELSDLLKNGYSNFLLREEDLSKAKMYEQVAKLPLIEKSLAPQERIRSIEDVGVHFIKCLYAGEITPSTVAKGEDIAQSLVACIAEDKSCIKQLSGLADHDFYTYYHSVRVATYAVAIALHMGLSTEEHLRHVALGGIFHDIGKKVVPLQVINKSGPLTEAEWLMMKSHPKQGFDLAQELILSHVSREIILHHHERINGTGYPDGLAKGSILLEVQIATVADIFDALTSSRSYQKRRTRFEALDFMKHKLLATDISPDVFRALVECLAT